jgi:hypothetical protein
MTTWTVIDEQMVHTVHVADHAQGVPCIDPALLGWQHKPEGLCRDDVCIPVTASVDAPLPVTELGRLLGRPVVIDTDERVVAFGASANERAEALRSGQAPDVELPDVNGVLHRLSDHQGRKIVLYAYASW